MQSSIGILKSNHSKYTNICNNEHLHNIKERFPNTYRLCNNEDNKFKLLLRKGIYPYDYMDSWDRFNETSLPSKEHFTNKLNLEDIINKDYEHAKTVWNTFNIKNLGEYHDLYVQSDTALLADVFEKFRNTCLEIYGLDPVHYVSLPGLAWDTYLKITNVELELFTNHDMLLMTEEGMRGELCQTSLRYAQANNKYMKNHNKDALSTFLEYYDANSLYGWAMCKKFPVGMFKWVKDKLEFTEKFIKTYDENSDTGYFLEVDVGYPYMRRTKHYDLPFLPSKRKINKVTKLIASTDDKEKYVVHLSALKQALNHGLKFTKVRRVIQFKQEAWLEPYIMKNTELRMNAKNEFEKDFFNLMNNAVFGKTMENIRNHRDIKLVTTDAKRRKLVSVPKYNLCKQFTNKLMAIEMNKTSIFMNKPIHLGQAILDISKSFMYEFWYNYFKVKYKDNVKLCYMDTNSFIFYVETEDFYTDIADDIDKWYDTSASSKDINNPIRTGINEEMIVTFKNELSNDDMTEFCSPETKTYAFDTESNEEIKKAKGTKKCVIEKNLALENYKEYVLKNMTIIRSQQRF